MLKIHPYPKFYMKKMLLIIIMMSMSSCIKTNEEIITSHQWKHGEGYRLGDWVEFTSGPYTFSNDTILKQGVPVALVDTITTYYGEYRLSIRSLTGNERGMYYEKGETR